MTAHTRDGSTHESLALALHDFSRHRRASSSDLEPSGGSNHISSAAGQTSFDDDRRSLVAHQASPEPKQTLLEGADDTRALRKQRHRFKSWKIGVITAAATTSVVLLINSIITIWASTTYGMQDGVGTMYEGSCAVASSWSLWLHIAINGLSSTLLSASNYTMQCVTAPTRLECDQAHSRGDWLDIGVPSIRNLWRIGRQRRIWWALLAFSSTPIHLLYNSSVFQTKDDNVDYSHVVAGRKFLTDDYTPKNDSLDFLTHDRYMPNRTSFKNLSVELCIETYATYYLSGHRDVLIIIDDTASEIDPWQYVPKSSPSLDDDNDDSEPFAWMCENSTIVCNSPTQARAVNNERDWTFNKTKVDYCLSESVDEHCKLQFSPPLLIAVIICNVIKCVTMLWVVWQQRETTFITFGDALANYLDKPDQTTADRCFESFRTIWMIPGRLRHLPRWPDRLDKGTRHWSLGVSRRRWVVNVFCLGTTVVAGCACLGLAVRLMDRTTSENLISLGFGTSGLNKNMQFTIGQSHTGILRVLLPILVANSPQVLIAYVYLTFNALITSMLLANEYCGYETTRKSLRVTTPCTQQRTTYWLQVPCTYAVPLITISAILHWLVSQSIFLNLIQEANRNDELN